MLSRNFTDVGQNSAGLLGEAKRIRAPVVCAALADDQASDSISSMMATRRLACIPSLVASSRWLRPEEWLSMRRIPACAGLNRKGARLSPNRFAACAPTWDTRKGAEDLGTEQIAYN